jgi:hypothetical protein
MAHLSQKEIVF